MDASLSLSLVLVALGAFLTVLHSAVVNTRPATLKEYAEEGKSSAKQLLVLLEAKTRFTLTYTLTMGLVHVAVATILAQAYGATLIAQYGSLIIFLGVFVLTLALQILTVIAPEGVGSAYPELIAMSLLGVLKLWVAVFSPITALLVAISRVIAGAFGGASLVNTVTQEEIMTLVNAGEIEEDEKDMIYSVLQLDERDARQLMVPRMDIVAINVTVTAEQALDTFIGSGYSRLPVYEEVIDNIVGVLYAKDMLNFWRRGGNLQTSIRDLMRQAFFVPETLPADELLKTLRAKNVHLAIVVDEYGGTSGLVTIENLIEEIIGDIRDEFDQNEEAEYEKVAENEYLIDATMNIADINDLLELQIDDSEYDTLGGYIYTEMGHVPHVGETLVREAFTLTVSAIEGRRIRKVRFLLNRDTQATPEEQSDAPAEGEKLPSSEPSAPDEPLTKDA